MPWFYSFFLKLVLLYDLSVYMYRDKSNFGTTKRREQNWKEGSLPHIASQGTGVNREGGEGRTCQNLKGQEYSTLTIFRVMSIICVNKHIQSLLVVT